MKKLMMSLFLVLMMTTMVHAEEKSSVVLFLGSNKAFVGEQKMQIDTTNSEVAPIVENGRTFVPLRFIGESLGAEVSWDGPTQTATLTTSDKTISLVIGKSTMIVNDKVIAIDAPAQIKNGRTLLPLRAISEALDQYVYYQKGFISIGSEVHSYSQSERAALLDELTKMEIAEGYNIVGKNGWFYFYTNDPFDVDMAFYKIKADGTQKQVLDSGSNAAFVYFMIVEDWLYYTKADRYVNGRMTIENNVLYRMKTDGTKKQRLTTDKDIVEYTISPDGKWIFYAAEDNDVYADGTAVRTGTRSIFKMKSDGTGKTKIYTGDYQYYTFYERSNNTYQEGTHLVPFDLTVIGDNLYFAGLLEDAAQSNETVALVFKIKTDGSGFERITDKIAGIRWQFFDKMYEIQDGWIYFREKKSSEWNIYKGSIFKQKLDGSGKMRVTENTWNIYHFRIDGDWIIYNDTDGFYIVQIDGTQFSTLTTEESLSPFEVFDGYIYSNWISHYYKEGRKNMLYHMKTDGSENDFEMLYWYEND
jgi:hypothetical protein